MMLKEGDWDKVVELAMALNASEELQAEFNEAPRAVLSSYGLEVTDEELADIRRVLEVAAQGTTEVRFVPLARPHGHKTKDCDDD